MKKHISDKFLSRYIDGDLNTRMRVQAKAHLKGCPTCRKHLAEMKSIKDLARKLTPAEVPEGMLIGIRERITGARIEAEGRPTSQQTGFWHGIAVGAALSAAVIVFIVLPHVTTNTSKPTGELLTLEFAQEAFGPPLGLANAHDFGFGHPKTPPGVNVGAQNGRKEDGVHTVALEQPRRDSNVGWDSTPRIFMVPLDDEARRQMAAERGEVPVFSFQEPHIWFIKHKQDTNGFVVPAREINPGRPYGDPFAK